MATGIYDVTATHEFISGILQCLNISYSYELPTAGVRFDADHKRWEMYINPFFFCRKLNQKQRKAVLVHEIAHILHKHPFRIPFLALPDNKRSLINVSADMCVNQTIPDLPSGCSQCPPVEANQPCENPMCPGRCIDIKYYYDEDQKGKKTPWPNGKTTEFYYEKLLTKFKDALEQESEGDCESCGGDGQEKDGNGNPTGNPCPDCKGTGKSGKGSGKGLPQEFDSHDWDATATESEMLDATEELVQRAMIKRSLSYDKLPGAVQELLSDIKARKAELNYKGIIMSALKRHAAGFDRDRTWNRKSRRYGYIAPGTHNAPLPKLSLYLDSSGSISVEELNEFLEIVDEFLRVGSKKCEINFFHTSNYLSQPYKRGDRFDRKKVQSGGTDLEDSIKRIMATKPDLAVFITDGYYSDVAFEQMLRPSERPPQVVFIISKGGTEDHPLKRLGFTVKAPNNK